MEIDINLQHYIFVLCFFWSWKLIEKIKFIWKEKKTKKAIILLKIIYQQ